MAGLSNREKPDDFPIDSHIQHRVPSSHQRQMAGPGGVVRRTRSLRWLLVYVVEGTMLHLRAAERPGKQGTTTRIVAAAATRKHSRIMGQRTTPEKPLTLWRNHDYLLLFLGQAVSSLGI